MAGRRAVTGAGPGEAWQRAGEAWQRAGEVWRRAGEAWQRAGEVWRRAGLGEAWQRAGEAWQRAGKPWRRAGEACNHYDFQCMRAYEYVRTNNYALHSVVCTNSDGAFVTRRGFCTLFLILYGIFMELVDCI